MLYIFDMLVMSRIACVLAVLWLLYVVDIEHRIDSKCGEPREAPILPPAYFGMQYIVDALINPAEHIVTAIIACINDAYI